MSVKNISTYLRQKFIAGRIPEGAIGMKLLGHRLYVGGQWKNLGSLQFEYLLRQGLAPDDCFLDIGCGALRGGVHFIKYLHAGKYLGIDKEDYLIATGIRKELGEELFRQKRPEFVSSASFEFMRFSQQPRFSLAFSLFTHLCQQDVERCFVSLRDFVQPGHIFFATFFEGDSCQNREISHTLDHFEFSRNEMAAFGENYGWHPDYIGEWGHPRRQMMMKYVARPI